MQKIENFLDFIIKWLTAFCWWVDTRFDKDNVWVSKVSFLAFLLVGKGVYFFIFFKEINLDEYALVFIALISSLIVYVLFIFNFHAWGIFSNAKTSPNSNRKNLWKGFMFFLVVLVFIFCIHFTFQEVFCLAVLFSSFLILCTEVIPPAEKKKRQAKIAERKAEKKAEKDLGSEILSPT